ncbi:hypothetical protein [Pseudomonas sp. ERMR1:02]|uniref:hypothetical protein n=1 Tax=Pseudomonas sp. ERMR1:02 TaxID=1805930 RepID=UPI001C4881A5|nr:hypothetical protein [Pseudomonas sp. ERMR1:02]
MLAKALSQAKVKSSRRRSGGQIKVRAILAGQAFEQRIDFHGKKHPRSIQLTENDPHRVRAVKAQQA